MALAWLLRNVFVPAIKSLLHLPTRGPDAE